MCLPIFAFGAQFCEIRKATSDEIGQRSIGIKFPDGREIIVVGHNHGERENVIKLSLLAKKSQGELSDKDFVKELDSILEGSEKSVVQAKQDIQFLRSVLTKNPNIKFVVNEATQQEADENLEYFSNLKNNMYFQVWGRSLRRSQRYQDAIMGVTGAESYLKITEPHLFKDRKFLGLEDKAISGDYERSSEKFNEARDKLKLQAQHDPEFLKKISETYDVLMALYPKYDPKIHDRLLLDGVVKNTPEKYKEASLDWMKAGIVEMQALKKRDRVTVDGLLNQNSSGVLLIGLWHLQSIARELQRHCKSQLAQTSSQSSLQNYSGTR